MCKEYSFEQGRNGQLGFDETPLVITPACMYNICRRKTGVVGGDCFICLCKCEPHREKKSRLAETLDQHTEAVFNM